MFCSDFKSESREIEVRAVKIPLKTEAKLAENDLLGKLFTPMFNAFIMT